MGSTVNRLSTCRLRQSCPAQTLPSPVGQEGRLQSLVSLPEIGHLGRVIQGAQDRQHPQVR